MMIDFGLWDEAVRQTYKHKRQEFYLDDLRRKGPKNLIE
jgi:hypothetical protein